MYLSRKPENHFVKISNIYFKKKKIPKNNFGKIKNYDSSLDISIRKNKSITISWALETEARCVQYQEARKIFSEGKIFNPQNKLTWPETDYSHH